MEQFPPMAPVSPCGPVPASFLMDIAIRRSSWRTVSKQNSYSSESGLRSCSPSPFSGKDCAELSRSDYGTLIVCSGDHT